MFGWQVMAFVPTPATRDEPAGGDVAAVGSPLTSSIAAASLVVRTWMAQITDQHFESASLDSVFEQMLEDDRLAKEYFASERAESIERPNPRQP